MFLINVTRIKFVWIFYIFYSFVRVDIFFNVFLVTVLSLFYISDDFVYKFHDRLSSSVAHLYLCLYKTRIPFRKHFRFYINNVTLFNCENIVFFTKYDDFSVSRRREILKSSIYFFRRIGILCLSSLYLCWSCHLSLFKRIAFLSQLSYFDLNIEAGSKRIPYILGMKFR